MDVVYFGSREIYGDFYTAIRSLLAHNPDARVYTLTEDPDPFYDLPVRNIIWLPHDYFNDLNLRTKWKQFGPIRAAFTKVFPHHERIISIDCDTIVRGDISPLWNMDLHGCHVAMCREVIYNRPYFNNGICVMDLKKIREDGLDDWMISDLNNIPMPFVGQDAMQRRLDILELDSRWNASKFTRPCDDPVIVHYADRTDWRELPEVLQYR